MKDRKIAIKAAALRYPDGMVYTGRDHGRCFRRVNREYAPGTEQGFVTVENVFVGRVEAGRLAFESGQIETDLNGGILFSEEIWSRGGPYNGLCDYNEITGYYFRD